jgi:hypothetical protein
LGCAQRRLRSYQVLPRAALAAPGPGDPPASSTSAAWVSGAACQPRWRRGFRARPPVARGPRPARTIIPACCWPKSESHPGPAGSGPWNLSVGGRVRPGGPPAGACSTGSLSGTEVTVQVQQAADRGPDSRGRGRPAAGAAAARGRSLKLNLNFKVPSFSRRCQLQ